MITTVLQGGLANQMFQYAFGLAQSFRFNTSLKLDITSFKNDRMRQFNLDLFEGVTEPVCTGSKATVLENGMPYNSSLIYTIMNGSVLRGYWQTEKYFINIRPQLLNVFKPKQRISDYAFENLKKILNSGDKSVFITIRRTDYLNSDYHGVLPMSYYEEAANIIASNISNPQFFVFSDEPEWCKKNFNIPYPFEVIGSYNQTTSNHIGREDEDIWLMSRCRHAIMANSSFSWWGAWLNPLDGLDNRIVVAPEKWFNNSPEDPRDIVPSRWMRI